MSPPKKITPAPPISFRMAFAMFIFRERQQRKWTQEELGERLGGRGKSTISQWESGTHVVDSDGLLALFAVLGYNMTSGLHALGNAADAILEGKELPSGLRKHLESAEALEQGGVALVRRKPGQDSGGGNGGSGAR